MPSIEIERQTSTGDMSIEVSASAGGGNVEEVDEKLYSRQLYVMGHEAQRRMMASHVLLVGLSGLGAEIAKNVSLAGVKSLTLHDPHPATWSDLGGNFYLTAADVRGGVGRAAACRGKLAELNQYVEMRLVEAASELLGSIQGSSCVVVTIPLPEADLIAINDACRAKGACFINTLAHGVFGSVFCDFGPSFTVTDRDGENPATSQVESVLASNPGVVRVLEDQGRHGLDTGDVVRFSRVKGMPELNDTEHVVNVTGPYTFEIGDLSSYTPATQGYIAQVKQPTQLAFRTYQEATAAPGEMMLSDFAKFDRPPLLHLGFRALAAYRLQHGNALPAPGDEAAVAEVLAHAATLDPELVQEGDNAALLRQVARGASACLSPMCATLGGIVGQEVLKACSGKFTPIQGFFYFDAAEALPDGPLPAPEIAPRNSRYDSQIAVFGAPAQEALLNLNYFLVGAGAIGCEMLKNWALMGVGCGAAGKIHITDMDRIEKSNLSRQFLFRNTDINEFKASTGAKAARAMNPDLNIVDYQEKVGGETEGLFGDQFYDTLSGVCTALDNVEARLYMDQRCVFYRLPMLESGTLGTKGNTQVVVPHLTENYGATRDPPEKSIPVCTLKNFPNQIQHTLQWARDYFEGVFKQNADDVNQYLTAPDFGAALAAQQNTKVETARSIRRTLVEDRPTTFEQCVTWARLRFEELFHNQIRQLLHNFPPDQRTSSGALFWSGSKRCPQALDFDVDATCADAAMRNHFDFIVAASNLRADVYGIKGRTDEEFFREYLGAVMVPEFSPVAGVKIAANEAEAKEQEGPGEVEMDVDSEFEAILAELPPPNSLAGFRLEPIEFDKDIDDHMLFVTACSNLRALCYSIPTEDTHRSRAIAGKIIPAIATTTAMVTGLVCLELYKTAGTARKVLTREAYKSAFCNLAIPFMTLSEPTPPAQTTALIKGKKWEWTAWDSLDMNQGDITLKEFMDYFATEYNLEVSMLSQGVSIVYSFFANKAKVAERMGMPMSQIVTSITKKEFPENQLFIIFEMIANDLTTEEEVDIPYIKYRFR
eukprot:CAMPEP_0194316908 /NCGR_PEP_ID=MMETSP0171-20130528/13663_1 /TAXON_ID=218684 /ORGANISM="Corethron pennatum, Strain L29A3" /LENGTH=1050 /DNA_ID=CAMNT_0039073309 /DNA_START=113 /DNA_END=3265 /DNA_ORIENTATION=+